MTSIFIDEFGYLFGSDHDGEISTFKKLSENKFLDVCSSTGILTIDGDGRSSYAVGLDQDGSLWICRGILSKFVQSNFEFIKLTSQQFFTMVSCGLHNIVAIDLNGSLWMSRSHTSQPPCNELGDKFEKVTNDNKFKMVCCGHNHTMAIDENGCLWGFGENKYGQLGFGDIVDRDNFEKLAIDNQFVMVSCAESHTIAIDENGVLWGSGSSSMGQLGIGRKRINKLERLPINKKIINISCGACYTMVIDENGRLWCCGLNTNGQLGLGHNSNTIEFKEVQINKRFTAVNCECFHTMAIDENGSLWMCGCTARQLCSSGLSQSHMDVFQSKNKFNKVDDVGMAKKLMNSFSIKKPGSNTKGSHKLF